MSSKKKKGCKSDSPHGALLFLCYHWRVFHPNNYSAVEIYGHLDLPFKDNYSKKSGTHCATLLNRCNNYELRGNTLSGVFWELVDDKKIRSRPLFEQLLSPGNIDQHYNIEEDDDGSYIDKSEDDLSFEADTKVGSLSALLRNQVTMQQRRRQRRKQQQQQKRNLRNHKPISVSSVCFFYFVLFLFLFTNPICVSILFFLITLQSSSTKTTRIFYPW